MNRYIIRQGEQRVLAAMLEHLANAVEGQPQEVIFRDYQTKRSTEQNSAYWAMLSEIRDWLWDHHGDPVFPEVLHMQMKQMFQPILGHYTAQIPIDGVLTWVDVPIPKSTTRNSVKEMSEYMQKVEAYAATEYGVEFQDRKYRMDEFGS